MIFGLFFRSKELVMKTLVFICITAYATLVPANLCATTITSTFDTDLDGWTTNPQGTIAFVATGGNPDGYLEETDAGSTGNMHVTAPNKFLGDLTGADTLSVDIRVLATPTNVVSAFGVLTFLNSGAGLSMTLDLGAPSTLWTNYATPLSAGAFGVTASTFSTIMSNVTGITLILEADKDVHTEKVGMDNFTISGEALGLQAVPEPAPFALVGTTLVICGLLRTTTRRRI
jgi:hypothetical protein